MSQRPEIEPQLDVEAEYRTIETALLETARGRWFLAEHSKRSRRLESVQLETALDQLKSSMRDPPALLGRLQTDLEAVCALVERARFALDARAPLPDKSSSDELHAPTALLEAAEKLHAHAWDLQARDVNPEVCEDIGRQTAKIFALSVRQAQESQRARKHAEALDAISDRITAVLRTILFETSSEGLPTAPNDAHAEAD